MLSVVSSVPRENGEPSLALGFRNLIDALADAAASGRGMTLVDARGRETFVSFATLRESAFAVGNYLRRVGVAPGESVPIFLPSNRHFVESFFGTIFAGAIPAPIVYGPCTTDDGWKLACRKIARELCAQHFLTTEQHMATLSMKLPQQVVCPEDAWRANDSWFSPHVPLATETAARFCSIGDDLEPICSPVAHRSLLAEAHNIDRAVDLHQDDILVNWLPLDTMNGFVANVVVPLAFRTKSVVLHPSLFGVRLRQPQDGSEPGFATGAHNALSLHPLPHGHAWQI